MTAILDELFTRRVLIVGMGNLLRRDDAAGLRVVAAIERALPDAPVLTVEDVIENHAYRIAESDADVILIIDAVVSGQLPGTVTLAPAADIIDSAGFSTHKAALSITTSILAEHGKDVRVLGIEAADIDFGTGLTEAVALAADRVADMLIGRLECCHYAR